MKTNKELYNERMARIKKVISLEKTDKTVCIPFADSFLAKQQGAKLADFVSNLELSHKIMIDGTKWMGDIEAAIYSFCKASAMEVTFFSKVKLPGRELAEDVLWQVDERELMTPDDYDTIINKGFEPFYQEYFANRINKDLAEAQKVFSRATQFNQNMRDAGYPIYLSGAIAHPIDYLSSGRTMGKFMVDMRRTPDKVAEVMDIICDANIAQFKKNVSTIVEPVSIFVAMGRGCPDFYNLKVWEKFVWRYIEKIAKAIIETGIAANFHIDGNWERGLDYFKEFPKGTCVFETDGTTDIYKIKEKLGDIMCIKGDLPAATLALGTPDEVYNYSKRLIKDMGNGFILSSGCDVPHNAKPENVKAMISAAAGK